MRQGSEGIVFSGATEAFVQEKAAQIRRLVQPDVEARFNRGTRIWHEMPLGEILSEQYIASLVRLCLQIAPDVTEFTHIVSDELSGREHAVVIRKLVNLMRANLHTDQEGKPLAPLPLEFLDFNNMQKKSQLIDHVTHESQVGQGYDYSKILLVTEAVNTGRTVGRFREALQGAGFENPAVLTMLISDNVNVRNTDFDYFGAQMLNFAWPDYYMNLSRGWGMTPPEPGFLHSRPLSPRRQQLTNQTDLNTIREVQDLLAETIFWQLFGDQVRPKGQA